MHKSVLMHPNIHKGSKINHISHGSLEHQPGVRSFISSTSLLRMGFGISSLGVSSRLFQLFHNISQGRFSQIQLCGQLLVVSHLFEIPLSPPDVISSGTQPSFARSPLTAS